MRCPHCQFVWFNVDRRRICPKCKQDITPNLIKTEQTKQPQPPSIPESPKPEPQIEEPPILLESQELKQELITGPYLSQNCPWSLNDIIEELLEIYSIPLTRNQFIATLTKNSYIINAVLAYETAIQEKIITETNGRITKNN